MIRIRGRGRHKLFIGMAPGVGKTFRMLQEAQQLRRDGTDVVIGVLETHGRADTAAQAEGLERVPLRRFQHQGVWLEELDLAALLLRRAQLVLVDELAHTNAPGSERTKRWQDVELLLASGLDVYSTVNIQHLESLNDLVAQLTGVVVRERLPDRVLERADEVVLVDVTPETLQERLRGGKVYASEKVGQALANFFSAATWWPCGSWPCGRWPIGSTTKPRSTAPCANGCWSVSPPIPNRSGCCAALPAWRASWMPRCWW